MPATFTIQRVYDDTSVVDIAPPYQLRFRLDTTDDQDNTSPVEVPDDVFTLTTGPIAAGVDAPQSVPVVGVLSFTIGDFLIASPGDQTYQEVVQITDLTTEIVALFQKKHAAGTVLRLCKAARSKTFRMAIKAKPEKSAAKFRLQRQSALPDGIFDQWMKAGTVYTPDQTDPIISAAGFKTDAAPTVPAVFDSAAYTAVGATAMFRLQWLTTGAARGLEHPPVTYRILWDES